MNDDHFNEEESAQRLAKSLKGAFAGRPTPLKAIPKKREESRAQKTAKNKEKR
jgi:hypothetical protein